MHIIEGSTNVGKYHSEHHLRTIFEAAAIGIVLVDLEGRWIEVNPTLAAMLGYRQDELRYKSFTEVTHPDDLAGDFRLFNELVSGVRERYVREKRYFRRDASMMWGRLTVSLVRTAQGEPQFCIGMIENITEQKRIEEELRRSENRFRMIFQSAGIGMDLTDLKGRYVETNRALQEMLGYAEEELRGKSILDVTHPEDAEIELAPLQALAAGKIEHFQMEKRYYRKDGSLLWARLTVSLGRNQEDEPQYMIGMIENISRRKQMEEELRESEKRFRAIFESVAVGMVRVDLEGKIMDSNIALQEMLSYSGEELRGFTFQRLTHDDDLIEELPLFHELITEKRKYYQIEKRYVRKDQSMVWVKLTASFVAGSNSDNHFCAGIVENISERKKMEEELLNRRKLDSLGVLAGGIAHDFNNILTVILGNISLAKTHLKPEDKLYDKLVEAEKASLQAKDLTRQLLTFAKGGAPILKAASIAGLIEDSVGFALRGSNIICELKIADDLPPVEIDEGQISQVLNNIMINAVQAMPDGGKISLATSCIESCGEPDLPLRPGKYLEIVIGDEGYGIPAKNLVKIFDPYFTTKAEGSGLGLATAYSIVKKHKGWIKVDSKVGIGTKFTIYLPVSTHKYREAQQVEEVPITGQGRILVMDDDAAICKVIGTMLRQFGYEADFAKDGEEMIELYLKARREGTPFAALILDLTIPGGVGGKEALRRLVQYDSNAKAIASSGYSNDPVMANYQAYGFKGVIAKPFKAGELSKVLAEVLKV